MRNRRSRFTLLVVTAAALALPAAAHAAGGSLAYVSKGNVYLQPVNGGAPSLRADALKALYLSASRDGSQVAVVGQGSDGEYGRIVFLPLNGGDARAISFKGLSINSVDISPNGSRIAFTAFRKRDNGVGHVFAYTARADGTGLRSLPTRTRFAYDIEWSRTGRSMLYIGDSLRGDLAGCGSVRRIRSDGKNDRLLYRGAATTTRPCPVQMTLSPLGGTVALAAVPNLEEGLSPPPATGVYRLSLSRGATPVLLADKAVNPAWSPDGLEVGFTTAFDPRSQAGGPALLQRVDRYGGSPSTVAAADAVSSLDWVPGG